MNEYESVLKRLVKFRKLEGYTQSEMAEKLNLSQERYSNMENGRAKITFQNMLVLYQCGLDLDYLIAGKIYNNNEETLKVLFGLPEDSKLRKQVERLALYAMCVVIEEEEISAETNFGDKISFLNYLSKYWKDFTMLRYIREHNECSQSVIADELGVCIKKYRLYEREVNYPDAELVLRLYRMTGYQPSLFLRKEDRELSIMGTVWSELTPECQTKVVKVVKSISKAFLE